ncbi:MAG: MmcQ-like protein, partial [Arthrobacter sp.]|nr:MmcQ-like protein [Arthrobacter sp.]
MDAAALRTLCLDFPGAFEDFPFGPELSVFKVRAAASGGTRHEAKMFALSAMDKDNFSVSLKCEPALAEQLRAVHPEITGAWHLNKTHWNGVR